MNKNNFAVTPPMGWNSYDYYDTTVNEAQIRANAEYMAKHLKKYGWEYVVIDIEWYSNDAGTQRDKYQYIPFGDDEMDEYSRFQPSPKRFPSSADGTGFTKLAEYIHSLGLKFGIHIMRGIPRKAAEQHCAVLGTTATANEIADANSICIWNPDMYGVKNTPQGQAYYDSLIAMYAQWGVDFIKCDDICDSRLYREEYFNGWHETRMLHEAILKSGRDIVLSLSPGPAHIDLAWQYCEYANMWRITDDLWDDWKLLKNMFWRCEMWQDHVRQGCFPDCDMLPVGTLGGGFGNGEWQTRFTKDEQKTLMTLWCMFRSPLMIGAELTKMDDWTLSLLTNEELLALMGEHCKGKQLRRTETEAVWINVNSENNDTHVALFNLGDEEQTMTVSLEELEADKTYTLHELWDKTDAQITGNEVKAVVPAHGVKVYKIK
ncbi:MAG TPA: alpha-galactosidase [Lachnospiraceae bacterium]|nr:alpha-galactosidase [Lachnospiraceae bacterium]